MDAASGRRVSVAGRAVAGLPSRRRIAGLVAVGAVVGVALVAAMFVLHGPVRAESLYSSVSREAGSSTMGDAAKLKGIPERCLRTDSRRWRCEVVDSGQSGTVTYEVRARDGSCWSGRLRGPVGEPMPDRIDGCVRLVD